MRTSPPRWRVGAVAAAFLSATLAADAAAQRVTPPRPAAAPRAPMPGGPGGAAGADSAEQARVRLLSSNGRWCTAARLMARFFSTPVARQRYEASVTELSFAVDGLDSARHQLGRGDFAAAFGQLYYGVPLLLTSVNPSGRPELYRAMRVTALAYDAWADNLALYRVAGPEAAEPHWRPYFREAAAQQRAFYVRELAAPGRAWPTGQLDRLYAAGVAAHLDGDVPRALRAELARGPSADAAAWRREFLAMGQLYLAADPDPTARFLTDGTQPLWGGRADRALTTRPWAAGGAADPERRAAAWNQAVGGDPLLAYAPQPRAPVVRGCRPPTDTRGDEVGAFPSFDLPLAGLRLDGLPPDEADPRRGAMGIWLADPPWLSPRFFADTVARGAITFGTRDRVRPGGPLLRVLSRDRYVGLSLDASGDFPDGVWAYVEGFPLDAAGNAPGFQVDSGGRWAAVGGAFRFKGRKTFDVGPNHPYGTLWTVWVPPRQGRRPERLPDVRMYVEYNRREPH